jgi:hypothetical protein
VDSGKTLAKSDDRLNPSISRSYLRAAASGENEKGNEAGGSQRKKN